jgi:hypothetical protein
MSEMLAMLMMNMMLSMTASSVMLPMASSSSHDMTAALALCTAAVLTRFSLMLDLRSVVARFWIAANIFLILAHPFRRRLLDVAALGIVVMVDRVLSMRPVV